MAGYDTVTSSEVLDPAAVLLVEWHMLDTKELQAQTAAAGLIDAQTAEALTLAASHSAANQSASDPVPARTQALSGTGAVAAAKSAVQEAVKEAMVP